MVFHDEKDGRGRARSRRRRQLTQGSWTDRTDVLGQEPELEAVAAESVLVGAPIFSHDPASDRDAGAASVCAAERASRLAHRTWVAAKSSAPHLAQAASVAPPLRCRRTQHPGQLSSTDQPQLTASPAYSLPHVRALRWIAGEGSSCRPRGLMTMQSDTSVFRPTIRSITTLRLPSPRMLYPQQPIQNTADSRCSGRDSIPRRPQPQTSPV